ncbi:MAG: GFA family protein [Caulobacteraceae bacterium]
MSGGKPIGGKLITGGCLCGALCYEASAEPMFAGFCCCADCRKASGGGSIGFMGFAASVLTFTGPTRQFTSKAANGGDATRNFCPTCGGLVFGGIVGQSDSHTVYAGSLDDPAAFRPTMAIFNRDRPDWAPLPAGLTVFETMPTAG